MTHLSNLMLEVEIYCHPLPEGDMTTAAARISHCAGGILATVREMCWLTPESIKLVFTPGEVKA